MFYIGYVQLSPEQLYLVCLPADRAQLFVGRNGLFLQQFSSHPGPAPTMIQVQDLQVCDAPSLPQQLAELREKLGDRLTDVEPRQLMMQQHRMRQQMMPPGTDQHGRPPPFQRPPVRPEAGA